jgi:hypothetical protein
MRNRFASGVVILICAIALRGIASAQANPEAVPKDDTGFTSTVEFDGTRNSAGQEYVINSNVGYNFSKHFGMDVGLPYYFSTAAATTTTSSTSASGVGNPFVDLRWKFPGERLNYGTLFTGAAPLGDKSLGINTGHATFDWTNRFDHGFNQVTPFFEAGFSNTTWNTRQFVRQYTSYGLNTHFRGGAEVDVWKFLSVGAAGYDIAPFGNQTLFPIGGHFGPNSHPGVGSQSSHGNSGGSTSTNSTSVTGTARLAKDYGYSAWVDATLNRYMDAELGYTRSASFDLNSVSFSLGFNVGKLAHRSR